MSWLAACRAVSTLCALSLATLAARADAPAADAPDTPASASAEAGATVAPHDALGTPPAETGPDATPSAATGGYPWRGPPSPVRDWPGARRDMAFFFGYQFVAVAVLYAAPESFTGWSPEDKNSYDFAKWRENVTNPQWDTDTWYVNYVLHPYWGATYYTRARERGLSRTESFWYSAALSAIWEFGAEALAEPVSIQDLIVTPVFGALVGEYLFAPLRERIRAKDNELDWADKTMLAITDPLGVLNAQFERWLGLKSTVTFQPIGSPPPARALAGLTGPAPALVRPAPVWGLNLHVEW
jgi:hypothetical protein